MSLSVGQVLEQYQVYADSVLGTQGNGRPNVRDLVKVSSRLCVKTNKSLVYELKKMFQFIAASAKHLPLREWK